MSSYMNSDWDIHIPVELLREAIIFSSCGYVIDDCGQKDNPVVFVNKAFQEITGYEAKDIIGKNCRLLLGKHREQEPLKELREAIKIGRRCTVVVRNYKKNGTPFYNELTIIASKKGACRIWSLRDVTDFVEAKEEMARLIAEKDDRFSAYLENSNGLFGKFKGGNMAHRF